MLWVLMVVIWLAGCLVFSFPFFFSVVDRFGKCFVYGSFCLFFECVPIMAFVWNYVQRNCRNDVCGFCKALGWCYYY